MKFLILFFCICLSSNQLLAKTVYYQAINKIIDGKGKVMPPTYSLGEIVISDKEIQYLDYLYEEKGGQVSKSKNYLEILDRSFGMIHWVFPVRDPIRVRLVYTDGKLTGQRGDFKDKDGRLNKFQSDLTDKNYSYSLHVYNKDGTKAFSMVSASKFISKNEFDSTLKEISKSGMIP